MYIRTIFGLFCTPSSRNGTENARAGQPAARCPNHRPAPSATAGRRRPWRTTPNDRVGELRSLAPMAGMNDFKDLGFKLSTLAHRSVLNASGGRFLNRAFGMPVVQLHTVGRKSGHPRVTMLTAPIIDDQRVVLVASKGGDDRNPAWFLNLQANPDVELTVNGETKPMKARVASADEKAELWPQIVTKYKGYANYQTRTRRDIPVVILAAG